MRSYDERRPQQTRVHTHVVNIYVLFVHKMSPMRILGLLFIILIVSRMIHFHFCSLWSIRLHAECVCPNGYTWHNLMQMCRPDRKTSEKELLAVCFCYDFEHIIIIV
jgi:hypothetical protein